MSISQQLGQISELLKCQFTLRNQPISIEQVFLETGLLPAMMRRADQLSSFCLGYGLGLSFEEAPGSILGIKVKFDDTVANSLRLLCALDVLVELYHAAPSREAIPLDTLLAG